MRPVHDTERLVLEASEKKQGKAHAPMGDIRNRYQDLALWTHKVTQSFQVVEWFRKMLKNIEQYNPIKAQVGNRRDICGDHIVAFLENRMGSGVNLNGHQLLRMLWTDSTTDSTPSGTDIEDTLAGDIFGEFIDWLTGNFLLVDYSAFYSPISGIINPHATRN